MTRIMRRMDVDALRAECARPTRIARFRSVRQTTERLVEPLELEDFVVQTIEDVSPPKWHLAHTTWFFETFLLERFGAPGRVFDPTYSYLFNSYYEAIGSRVERARRGQLSRPTVADVRRYREHVDQRVERLLERGIDGEPAFVFELGLHHEQQHQELLLTDVKHILASNVDRPAYAPAPPREGASSEPARWVEIAGGLVEIGHDGDGFGFDNEFPRHRQWLEDFALADRLVTNGEYLRFVEDGGYRRSELWLSDGWQRVRDLGWTAPLYWEALDGRWHETTLHGRAPLALDAPVCHVGYFEADAFARWQGARLPSEVEWEHGAQVCGARATAAHANLFDGRRHHVEPARIDRSCALRQMLGDAWEWTASAYLPYAGHRPWGGAIGEYNAKFMSGQMVLRGGSCATPRDHARTSYRNFFQPDKRWQFTGIRLARAT